MNNLALITFINRQGQNLCMHARVLNFFIFWNFFKILLKFQKALNAVIKKVFHIEKNR